MLIGNKFIDNLAINEGGVIKWNEIKPIIYENNSFINNTALYGNISAAFPFRLEMQTSENSQILCRNVNYNCYISLMNIASGSLLNFSLDFAMKDIDNEIYGSLNDGLL